MRRRTSNRIYVLAFLSIIILGIMSASLPSLAQPASPPGRLVLTSSQDMNFEGWSADEKTVGVLLDGYISVDVDLATGEFVQLPPPAPRQLTTTELEIFGIDVSVPSLPLSYYAISPDGIYVIYSVPAGPEYPPDLADSDYCVPRQLRLANRQTKLSVKLPFVQKLPSVFGWLKNSRSFIVGTNDGCGGSSAGFIAYVSNVAPALTDLRIMRFEEIAQLQSDNGYLQSMDFSSDGLWILAALLYYSGETRLVLVDVVNPDQSTIIADYIVGFLTLKFDYGTPTTILMLSEAGLTQLSLTGQQTVLNSTLTTLGNTIDCSSQNYVKDASFSPSGRWLAYIHCDDPKEGDSAFYLFDMNDVLNPNRPTPTIAPTFTPVGATNPLPSTTAKP